MLELKYVNRTIFTPKQTGDGGWDGGGRGAYLTHKKILDPPLSQALVRLLVNMNE